MEQRISMEQKQPKYNTKKVIKYIIRTILIVYLLILLIPIPINKEFKAVEIKLDDPAYLEKRTIQIDGKFYFNILGSHYFKGHIYVPEYQVTSLEMQRIEFVKSNDKMDNNKGVITYVDIIGIDKYNRPNKDYTHFGMIYLGFFLQRPVILLFKEKTKPIKLSAWSTDKGYCIVSSVDSREDALKVLKRYDIYPSDY